METQLHSSCTKLYPNNPSLFLKSSSLSNFLIAPANSNGFSGSTRIPFLSSWTVNGIPCDLVEITAFLNANDSSGTNGDNSHCEGRIKN